MHQSSLKKMKLFRERYLHDFIDQKLKIMDLGSQDVNGSYKPIFDAPSWEYIGVDAAPGKNVDLVLPNPYRWTQVPSNSVDVVISGQAFEHIKFFWLTAIEIRRVLKDSGICCIIAPSSGFEHRYPVDCWRFYPDGFTALAEFSGLHPVEVYTQWDDEEEGYRDGSNAWHDSVLIASKKKLGLLRHAKLSFAHWLLTS